MDAKLRVERFGIVADDIEAAALLRSFGTKGAYENMSAAFDGPRDLSDVSDSLLGRSQKVKYGSIVPDVERFAGEIDLRDVAREPGDFIRDRSESLPGDVDRRLGNIQNGNVAKTVQKQIVDECRLSPTYVDNRCRTVRHGFLDQGERSFKVRAIPTDSIRSFLAVDLVPMSRFAHGARSFHDSIVLVCAVVRSRSSVAGPARPRSSSESIEQGLSASDSDRNRSRRARRDSRS